MRKMASYYYDFQGPYVLGSPAGAWVFPLPLASVDNRAGIIGETAPSSLHPEAELQAGRGENSEATSQKRKPVDEVPTPDLGVQGPSPTLSTAGLIDFP